MSSHEEDIPLVPTVQTTTKQTSNAHHTPIPLFVGDFNQNIFLTRWGTQQNTTPLTQENKECHAFIARRQLTPIPNTSTFIPQGCSNYTHTNLINGFYIAQTHYNQYQCHTNTQLCVNLDHFPITLKLPPPPTFCKTNRPPHTTYMPYQKQRWMHSYLSSIN